MKISIIIPTYNEEETLPALLKSIKAQNFKDYEVIIADANSSDKTREIGLSYDCKIVEGGLPAKGRNNGAKNASGDILLFLDADLQLPKNYLTDMLEEFNSNNIDIAISQMIPDSEKNSDKLLHDLANKFMVAVENIKPHGAGCYGIIVKKHLHEKINGFDESLDFGEDTDYIERLAKISKFKVLRKPKVIVSTRRLEEDGILQLIKTYGKSTFNDFRGKKTTAVELNYSFEHNKKNNSTKNNIHLKNPPHYSKRGSLKAKTKSKTSTIGNKKVKKTKPIYLKQSSNHNNNFNNIKPNKIESKNPKKIKINKQNHRKNNKSIKGQLKNTKKSTTNKGISVKSDKKTVFYCVCGEGMGHAIRSGVILEKLTKIYNVHIFSGDKAYTYLNAKFDNVHEIGVYKTVYHHNSVDDIGTFLSCMKSTPSDIKKSYRTLFKLTRKLKPNIIVSDFENYSNLISNIMHIPLISLDNIHMITEAKIDLPPKHKTDFFKASVIVKLYVQYAKIHILTSFFNPPIREGRNSVIYPPILREDILNLKSENKNHVLVYQTSNSNFKLIDILKKINNETFIIYGFNLDKTEDNLIFRKFNEDIFYEDFRTAKAVITNGGFTLISEAIYLKKPIYSIPALGNFEQILNGYYVEKLSYGEYHEEMNTDSIIQFLNKLDIYQKKLNTLKKTDNSAIFEKLIESIEKYSKHS